MTVCHPVSENNNLLIAKSWNADTVWLQALSILTSMNGHSHPSIDSFISYPESINKVATDAKEIQVGEDASLSILDELESQYQSTVQQIPGTYTGEIRTR